MKTSHSSDQKVQQILAAVRTLLSKNGYAATTISQIAAEAQVSRGLLHYYFKNKEDILAHVVRANVEISTKLTKTIFTESRDAKELAEKMTNTLRHVMQTHPDFYHVFFEGWSMARQSDIIDKELRRLYQEFRDVIRSGLEDAVSQGMITPRIPLTGLAAVITSLLDGMGLQLMTEPELIENNWLWVALETSILSLLTGKLE